MKFFDGRFGPAFQHDDVSGGAENLQDEAEHTAREMARSAQTRLREQKDQVIGDTVERLRESVNSRLDRAADYLLHEDPREIVNQISRFAQARPVVFLAGAFALGILGGRFLKSSARDGA